VLAARDAGDLIALTTSGTTTSPRTIVRSTRSWWDSFAGYSELTGVMPGTSVWIPGPLTATMNLFAAVHATAVGARIVTDPESASHACLTPTGLDRRGAELGRGTRVVVAGGPLSRRAHERAGERGIDACSYYGAAELSFVAAGAHEEDLRPFPGVDLRIEDEQIWVSSPYLCEGIGPWATVGDRGRLDGERLVVLGRPGTATTAGATVALADIEGVLRAHAHGEVAVVALPHDGLGEIVTAVCSDADDLTLLRERSRELLPATHQPRQWRVVADLPLTGAGKVDRRALVELVTP